MGLILCISFNVLSQQDLLPWRHAQHPELRDMSAKADADKRGVASKEPDTIQGQQTTIMLRNLPNCYTREMLMQLLEEQGFLRACHGCQEHYHGDLSCHFDILRLVPSAASPFLVMPIALSYRLGGLLHPFRHPGEPILAPRKQLGGPWDQHDRHMGVHDF